MKNSKKTKKSCVTAYRDTQSTIIFALYEGLNIVSTTTNYGLNKGLKKIQLLVNKADSPKGNLLFALLVSSNKRLYA